MTTMAMDFPNAFAGIVARNMTSDRRHEVQRFLTVNGCLERQMATDMVCGLAKLRRAIGDFLKWENERKHDEAEWQEATDKLAIALNATQET